MAVTDAAIRLIMSGLPLDFDSAGVIALAATIRTEYLASSGLSSAKLDAIELQMAAHFTILAEERGGLKRKSLGEASETYREIHPRLIGFQSTRYGQQAIMLDTSGTLSTMINEKGHAELRVV